MTARFQTMRKTLFEYVKKNWSHGLPIYWENLPNDAADARHGYIKCRLDFGVATPFGLGDFDQRDGALEFTIFVPAREGMGKLDDGLAALEALFANQYLNPIRFGNLQIGLPETFAGFCRTDCRIGFRIWDQQP